MGRDSPGEFTRIESTISSTKCRMLPLKCYLVTTSFKIQITDTQEVAFCKEILFLANLIHVRQQLARVSIKIKCQSRNGITVLTWRVIIAHTRPESGGLSVVIPILVTKAYL